MSITPETSQAMHMFVQKDLLNCSERLEEERDQWKERCLELERENAALRAEKDRWENAVRYCVEFSNGRERGERAENAFKFLRDAIDAALGEEAKP